MGATRNLGTCTRPCPKLIETKAVFTDAKMSNEWNTDFLQNSLLSIQYIYYSYFFIYFFLQCTRCFSNLTLWWILNKKKINGAEYSIVGVGRTCISLCFTKNLSYYLVVKATSNYHISYLAMQMSSYEVNNFNILKI